MNFTETHPGYWFDDTKQYRINLASLVKRPNGEPFFYAGVLCEELGKPERTYWMCCGAMRPYKSMQAAVRAVKKHRRLWVSAIRASRRRLNRETNLERIKMRGHLGHDRNRNYVFASLPVWVREKSPQSPERIIPGYKKLCAKLKKKSGPKLPSVPTETSPTSASPGQPYGPPQLGVPFNPCLVCYARGWQYHPDSQTDPVEGNRHRETVRCEACKGTGQGTKKVCFKAYTEILNLWHIAVTIFKANVTRRQRALAKLTEQEIEALKVLGL